MLWVLLAVLVVAVLALYLLRERRGTARSEEAPERDAPRGPRSPDPGDHLGEQAGELPASGPADAPGRAPRAPAGTPGPHPTPPRPPAEPRSPELARADAALTQLTRALDIHTPRTEAARQCLAEAADRRRVATFLLGRARTPADAGHAEHTALEGLHYIRAARLAMHMPPGPALPPLEGQPEAGEVTEHRTVTVTGRRIDASPTPSAATPHHHPGGRIAGRPIPAGWYSEPWWRPAMAAGTWAAGSQFLFAALFSGMPGVPYTAEEFDHGAQRWTSDPYAESASFNGGGLPRTGAPPAAHDDDPPPDLGTGTPAPETGPRDKDSPPDSDPPAHTGDRPPPRPAPPPPVLRDHPADPDTDLPTPDLGEGLPPSSTPTAHTPTPYTDPDYHASGYGTPTPSPGNNGVEHHRPRHNGHRVNGHRGFDDTGGYESGGYEPGGLDTPY